LYGGEKQIGHDKIEKKCILRDANLVRKISAPADELVGIIVGLLVFQLS
jgi:hypothetical protein